MKKLFLFALLLSLLFLIGCGTNDTENPIFQEKNNSEEINNITQIEGDVPPVMHFYEVDMNEDGQTIASLFETTFNITVDKGVYWAEWNYGDQEDFEEIQFITEKTPGTAYELKTQNASGTTTYLITKVNDDGIWVMTNSQNDHHGYLYDIDAAIQYENNEEAGNWDDTPQQIIASIGKDWITLTKQDGEWVIYNECRYGSGGLHFDENGEWLEFHGGGDAYSKEILEMKRIDYNIIQIKCKGEFDEEGYDVTFTSTGEDIIIMNEGSDHESAFLLSSSSMPITKVDEECDEED